MTAPSPPAPARRVVLFLDFDGVLHHFFPVAGAPDADNRHFAFVPAFEAAVRACPCEVDIVIASTWRVKYPLEAMRAYFSPDIAARIIGITPRVGSGMGPGGRLAEVRAWLEANGRQDDPWVAIDDFSEIYEGDPSVALVHCHDCFAEREAGLLLQAVCDPEGYARSYPVKPTSPGLVIPGRPDSA